MPMPDWRGDIHRIGLAVSANAADGCEALLVGAESTIGRVERRAVKGAPWPILRVGRRADSSRGDQDAEKTERELHLYFPSHHSQPSNARSSIEFSVIRVQSFHASVLLSRALLERSVAAVD